MIEQGIATTTAAMGDEVHAEPVIFATDTLPLLRVLPGRRRAARCLVQRNLATGTSYEMGLAELTRTVRAGVVRVIPAFSALAAAGRTVRSRAGRPTRKVVPDFAR